jgi:hypothetical protein
MEEEMYGVCSIHGEMRNVYRIWLESLKGRDHFENLCIAGMIILKWMLWKYDGCGVDCCGSGKGPVAGSFEMVMNFQVL